MAALFVLMTTMKLAVSYLMQSTSASI